jgi:hypothetical protein
MAVITIPFDYDERTHPTTVPICIADTDAEGNAVHRGWIDLGVVPVVDRFFKIAERLLADKFRASEIAEYAVHSLSRTHGDNVGDRPTVQVLNSARLYAVDQRVGGRRYRRSLDVELFPETLEALEDQYDLASDIAACETLDKIVAQVEILKLNRVKEILPFMLRNADGAELTEMFGQKRNTITKQFYRGMRKAAQAAGITWY